MERSNQFLSYVNREPIAYCNTVHKACSSVMVSSIITLHFIVNSTFAQGNVKDVSNMFCIRQFDNKIVTNRCI